MRITWSTVLCTAAVFVLLLSGDESGDGVPSGPHLSNGGVKADVSAALATSRLTHNDAISAVIVLSTHGGRRLPQECYADVSNLSVANTSGNYAAVVRALVRGGWHTYGSRGRSRYGFVETGLSKGGWDLTVSRSVSPDRAAMDDILLLATDTTC